MLIKLSLILILSSVCQAANTYSVTITIASGEVSENLTDFPILLDLSDMPAGFWDEVKADGGDIRILDSGTSQIPQDLSRFDYYSKGGYVFFKDTVLTGSDNTWTINWGDAELDRLPNDNANGRDAVWSDYECVYTFGEDNADRTGNTDAVTATGDAQNFELTATLKTFTQDPHQGMTFDAANSVWYVINTNAIYKFNENFSSLLATNADPVGDVSTATGESLTHVGDGCLYGDYIIIPVNDYSAGSATTDYLCRFLKSDLSYDSSTDVSGNRTNLSGVCYNSDDGYLYTTYWDSMTHLDYWDPSDFSHEGTIELTNVTPFSECQGIEYWHKAFWLSSDAADEVYRCELDGYVQSTGLFGNTVAGENEGIAAYNDTLVILIDPDADDSYAEQ